MRPRVSLERRFWSKVNKTTGCWLWQGAIGGNGYGNIGTEHDDRFSGRVNAVHRVSWVLHFGPIPEGKEVCHTCDVKRCVRPDHFFLGDHKANADDMVQKGLHYSVTQPAKVLRGERHGRARLTADQVRAIKRRLAAGEEQTAMAEEYGVNKSTIHLIKTGRNWRHLLD